MFDFGTKMVLPIRSLEVMHFRFDFWLLVFLIESSGGGCRQMFVFKTMSWTKSASFFCLFIPLWHISKWDTLVLLGHLFHHNAFFFRFILGLLFWFTMSEQLCWRYTNINWPFVSSARPSQDLSLSIIGCNFTFYLDLLHDLFTTRLFLFLSPFQHKEFGCIWPSKCCTCQLCTRWPLLCRSGCSF